MRNITRLILTIIALSFMVMPARASDYTDMDVCLGKQILARILCKDSIEINYVTKLKDNLYLFSAFYANKETHFFVGVYQDIIRIQGKEFRTITSTIPYNFDETAKCGVVDYSSPDCTNSERIVCCSQKTVEEQLDQKFWDRPIPELLEEDLRNALEGDNATKPAPQEAPQQ